MIVNNFVSEGVKPDMENSPQETLQQYAARWATVEHESFMKRGVRANGMLCVIFDWAVEDKNSPVARRIAAGEAEKDVFDEFFRVWCDHEAVLRRLSGK